MKTGVTIFLLIFSLNILKAQSNDSVYTMVEQMPKFNSDVNSYLYKCIELPDIKLDSGVINTHAYVSFIIEKDGNVSNVKILRPSMPQLDSSIVKCIRGMPKWQAGMQNYKPVRVLFMFPIMIDIK